MAQKSSFSFHLPEVRVPRASSLFETLILLRLLPAMLFLLFALPARAQFKQPFVFAADPKGIAVYTRNDISGVLAPVAGSPFPSKEPVDFITLDFTGRFLFTSNQAHSKISMFTVDPNTGALQEVPNSPFASTHTNTPVFLSVESSGQFLYAINFTGSNANVSSLESFQIDATNLDLKPSSNGATDLPGLLLPCGAATHPSGKTFYAYLNNPTPSNPNAASFVVFNGSNGSFTYQTSGPQVDAACLAVDAQGQLLATSSGSRSLDTYTLNSDGTLGPFNGIFPTSGAPSEMLFDTFGRFLYVTFFEGVTVGSRVHVFSTSPNSALLRETSDSPLPSSLPTVKFWTVDPTAPLIYADQVYQVDPQTGIPSPILATSPLTPPAIFSHPPGSQPILGPLALLSSTSLNFGGLSIGQTSSAQTLIISSNGGQALSLNTLSITGANPGDFTETDNCHVPTALPVGSSCAVLISFTPLATGNRSAALTITDNGSPTTQSVALSGTGLNPVPAVTLIPGNLDFGTVTQGTSTTKNISITNSGTAPLHVATVALSGANVSDFSSSSASCNSAIPANSTCTVTVTFAPLAPGVRSTILSLTDDASDSPQTVQVSGNANPAFTASAAPGSSTTASVSAGQPAQYQLQLTPGSGYSGTISLTCSGAPLGAVCQAPSSVSITNGSAALFTVTVTTSGAAILPPSAPLRFRPVPTASLLPLLAFAAILFVLVKNFPAFEFVHGRNHLAFCGVLAVAILCVVLGVAGCGGGSAAIVPPPIITPSGTSTIVITPGAMSPMGQPLQLQPIQLTLTVK